MPKKKKEESKLDDQLIKELNDVKKRLNIMRDAVDDVLDAAERGLKKLLE